MDGLQVARKMYGGPPQAKPSAKAGGDGSKTKPPPEYADLFGAVALDGAAAGLGFIRQRGRAEQRQAFGPGVPQNELDDFEAGFTKGCARPDVSEVPRPGRELSGTGEGYFAGLRAGQRYRQRQQTDAEEQDEMEVFCDPAAAMEWYATGGPEGGGPRPTTVPASQLPPEERPATYERREERRRAER